MQIDADYTLEHFEEGNKFILLNTAFSRKFNYYLAKFGYPALIIILLGSATLIWVSEREFTSGTAMLLVYAVFVAFVRYRFSTAARRLYKLQERWLQSIFTLDETGISSVRKDGSAHGHFKWSAVDKWMEGNTAFFLLLGPSSFIRVPSGGMSPDEREQVRMWLAETPQAK